LVLSDEYIEKLLTLRQETDTLDFKVEIDVSSDSFVKIVKDAVAMANGVQESDLVFGVDDDFNLVGFDSAIKIDEGDVRTKLSKYLVPPVDFEYKELVRKSYLGLDMKFAVIHVFPSKEIVLPKQDGKWTEGDKERVEFRVNDVLVRSGSRTIKAGAYEFNQLLERKFITKATESQKYVSEFKRTMAERAKPLTKEETLVLNIFPITKMPDQIWRGKTDLANKGAVFDFLKQIPVPRPKIPPFIVREGFIWTFSTMSDGANPLYIAVESSSVGTVQVSNFLADPDRARWLIDLLNSCLRKHCETRRISYDSVGEKFYYRMPAGQKRFRDKYTLSGRTYPRTMAKYDYENKVVVHNAADLRFTGFDSKPALVVMPGLVFTSDGSAVISDDSTAALSTRLLHSQYNQSILRDIRMWISKISETPQSIRISDFGFSVTISTSNLSTDMHVGYNDEEDVLEVEEEETESGDEIETAPEESGPREEEEE
jgi:Schlafen, AlbA_2